jgi:hypothetical protein
LGTCVAGMIVIFPSSPGPVDPNTGDVAGDIGGGEADNTARGRLGDEAGFEPGGTVGAEVDNVAGGRPGDVAGHDPGGKACDETFGEAANIARGRAGDENGDGDGRSC